VDVVVEATGRFASGPAARGHLAGGAGRVVVTAPAPGADATLVRGVNDAAYDPAAHRVVSAASCTTNALAPVAKVLLERFGVRRGMAGTVHAYTNDQALLDSRHDDPRRGRAAAQNLVPTTSGAAALLGEVLPALAGRVLGSAVRAPVPAVSLAELVAETEVPSTAEEVNAALADAAGHGPLRGVLGYTERPLVSGDYRGDPRSAVVDGLLTAVVGGTLVKVCAWYDNEWGYACRVAELAARVAGAAAVGEEPMGRTTLRLG
jgi:glyceraldehyde 3-phosphate dehydrogenase